MSGELMRLVTFRSLAKKVRHVIWGNLLFSFLYNIIAIPAAMLGWLSPLLAATAMLVSSMSVIGNTFFLIPQKNK
jgi:P-type Cu+ transporter